MCSKASGQYKGPSIPSCSSKGGNVGPDDFSVVHCVAYTVVYSPRLIDRTMNKLPPFVVKL